MRLFWIASKFYSISRTCNYRKECTNKPLPIGFIIPPASVGMDFPPRWIVLSTFDRLIELATSSLNPFFGSIVQSESSLQLSKLIQSSFQKGMLGLEQRNKVVAAQGNDSICPPSVSIRFNSNGAHLNNLFIIFSDTIRYILCSMTFQPRQPDGRTLFHETIPPSTLSKTRGGHRLRFLGPLLLS